ncbi:MAG TPA: 2-(5'-triphosphoribosyl)-3'-dephospho CoA synthase [Pasteurellaceae bacterium]|nr:2-(5'-triphosphoribosyl)-3'-dephospho CoA synthase [Pasteurellaceae bacterium]
MFEKFYKTFSIQGSEVSLEQLLEARENRALLQQNCLHKYGQTILSLTLLAVGGVKKNPLLDYIFEKSLENLTALFARIEVKPTAEFIRPLETGHEALFVLPIDADKLKKAAIQLEDHFPLARLWDIDVIAANGRLLSRQTLGFQPRPCLLCVDNAKVCARSRKHALNDILAEIQQRAEDHFFAEKIGELASCALLEEARLTPKPGLVDCANNGAHQDMNLQTFEQSAVVLRPFFSDFVRIGMATKHLPESQILAQIRPLGQQAEKAMFNATGNINTHKGSIFAFGLLCCAIGRLHRTVQPTGNIDHICSVVAAFAQGLTKELEDYPEDAQLTAGVQLFREYGLTGARGEAESGFQLVRTVFPVLIQHKHLDPEHQLLLVLVHLMAKNQDTNIVHRGGLEGLHFVQKEAIDLLTDPDIYNDKALLKQRLTTFDKACIERNLSAGGSADLLALTIFFQSLSCD